MAQISSEALRAAIEQATSEVTSEVKSFEVSDLRAQLTDLAKIGGENAWTISYSTSSASIEKLRDIAQVGQKAAWTISYSTSRAGLETGIEKKQGR